MSGCLDVITSTPFAGLSQWRRLNRQERGASVMRGFIKVIVLSATAALVCAPSPARADGYVNPWAGVNFGSNVTNGRSGFGVSAGGMGGGVFGGEVNFGYSPSAFGTVNDFGNNTVLDLMGNVIVGAP